MAHSMALRNLVKVKIVALINTMNTEGYDGPVVANLSLYTEIYDNRINSICKVILQIGQVTKFMTEYTVNQSKMHPG